VRRSGGGVNAAFIVPMGDDEARRSASRGFNASTHVFTGNCQ
jgi:hypothetical protein